MHSPAVDRRAFILGAGAVAAIAPLLAGRGLAQRAAPAWEEVLRSIVGDARPTTDRMTFELPEIAENGNVVPFAISVDSPMTAQEHVKAIHVISTANPQPRVASFHFTLLSGKASAASRMRLAQTQEVIGLAELSDGSFLMTRRGVKVTIGGFGG